MTNDENNLPSNHFSRCSMIEIASSLPISLRPHIRSSKGVFRFARSCIKDSAGCTRPWLFSRIFSGASVEYMERKVRLRIRSSQEFRVGLSNEWERKLSVLPDRSPTSIFLGISCMFKLRGWSNSRAEIYFPLATITIRQFHIGYNSSCLPPKILHNHCFQILLGITVIKREIKDNQRKSSPGGPSMGSFIQTLSFISFCHLVSYMRWFDPFRSWFCWLLLNKFQGFLRNRLPMVSHQSKIQAFRNRLGCIFLPSAS